MIEVEKNYSLLYTVFMILKGGIRMFKKVLLVLLCLILCLGVGCKKETETLSVDRGEETSVPEEVVDSIYAVNPLTGVEDLTKGKELDRPVAITINNVSVAQPVQTGLGKADIVYETEVEGGITRLLAVFQDVTKVPEIGTVRSARDVFVDLALGHNALYVHHGQSNHVKNRLGNIDRHVVEAGKGGERKSNGLSREHTLYAHGDKIFNEFVNKGVNIKATKTTPWQTFAAEAIPVKFSNTANKVTVPFSSSYKTTMQYDATSGKYVRIFNGTERKDYLTNESLYFKNVFVLSTSIHKFPGCTDTKGHKEVSLNSGSGYYFVNGTYTPILWSKGDVKNSFIFTATDGSPLIVNAGNSWVCIADANRSQPIIE